MLQQQIDSLKSQINSLPEGDFFCTRNGKYFKWYHTDGHHHTLIPKKNKTYAEQLAKKKYLSIQLKELKIQKRAIDVCVAQYKELPCKAAELLSKNEEYGRLLATTGQPTSEILREWMRESYDKNTKYPEQLNHKAYSGNMVRSKSEELIDMYLSMFQIPFRYECALQVGNTTIYPDFTIRHPITGDVYYWEHFGMMDDSNYSSNAFSKLQLYMFNGIIPGKKLITTYETKDHPLDSEQIEKIIRLYFL